jgi:hypothetical protein
MTSPQDESAARNYVDLLRQKQFDRIEKDMDPSLDDGAIPDMLANRAAMFPVQQPVSIKVIGMNGELCHLLIGETSRLPQRSVRDRSTTLVTKVQ